MRKNVTILKNSIWLYLLQFCNTVLPLLTLPYVTRILGATQYGSFSKALNIITYIQVIVEYGFELTGARKISLSKNYEEIKNIANNIFNCRIFLCIISILILLVYFLLFKITQLEYQLILILFMMVVGTMFGRVYIFQGLQEMKYISVLGIIARSISVILIFIFVKQENHIFFYTFFYALTQLIIGITSFILTKIKYQIKYKIINIKLFSEYLREGWYLFTTSALSKIFSGVSITILGVFTTNYEVGIYSAIQKIALILSVMYSPIGQIIYPNISKFFSISLDIGLKKISIILKYVMFFTSIIICILILFRNNIIYILYGTEYVKNSYLLIPLALWLFFSILNNLLGIQILVASGNQKKYSKAFNLSILIILVSNLVLIYFFGNIGAAFATLFGELSLSIMLIFQIKYLRK